MLESILLKAGLKVGFYTSPHLVSFTERFRINRECIAKDTAASLIREVKGVINNREPPTFFEFTTAMTLIHFFRENVDIGIIEAGMGGRLDATNVINPLVSIMCKKKAAPFWRVGHHARYRRLPSGRLGYYGLKDRFTNLTLGLMGRYQYRNAALSLLALEILKRKGITVSEEAIQLGLADILWPGRLEEVSSHPTIILDGAHNPSAMR
jgi:dihydrofolate synthase/folylpolyglutamate synthase